jgi:hypothetical protein
MQVVEKLWKNLPPLCYTRKILIVDTITLAVVKDYELRKIQFCGNISLKEVTLQVIFEK